jgi:hypothetical protein
VWISSFVFLFDLPDLPFLFLLLVFFFLVLLLRHLVLPPLPSLAGVSGCGVHLLAPDPVTV